jgi:hypothetical protein
MRSFAACVVAVATTSFAMAVAPEAAADHDTVGGGRFTVYNSDDPCTYFEARAPYTVCNGDFVHLTVPATYIVVPLGPHFSVGCNTYAPDGSLFEHDDENLSEVPEKQQFWAEQGWGAYTPEAMCQLW